MELDQLENKIFEVTPKSFESLALEIFEFQYQNNDIYRKYVNAIKINTHSINSLADIPFLPIQFFKTQKVQTTIFNPVTIFESSGTTGNNSKHYIKDLTLYIKSFMHGFSSSYGQVEDWNILGLLPSYLEREHSSLIYMVNDLIQKSGFIESGFYLTDHEKLHQTLKKLEYERSQTLLIGVTFGLLDFAENWPISLHHTVVMETGGMKGRRKEMVRAEVHERLKAAFGVNAIHSEYGMTELLSQAYSKAEGVFNCQPWMRIMLRDEGDPLSIIGAGTFPTKGIINIIDLANIYSCSFIATDDLGILHVDQSFEVIGRLDAADIRGCSLLSV